MGQVIGYRRVSSFDQNLDRQDFEGFELDEMFEDKVSGSSTKRPQLQECLKYLRKGDKLIVHSIDRLARNLKDLLALIEQLSDKGVQTQFLKEGLIFNGDDNAVSKLMLQIIGAVAEFERSLIRERQAEGIAKAKSEGKYFKPSIEVNIPEVKRRRGEGESLSAIAKSLGISRQTLYNRLND